MATSANIGLEREDGTIIYVSCHYDGDVKGVGKILEKSFKKPENVRKIIERGNMRSMADKISEIQFFLKRSDLSKIPQDQRENIAENRDNFLKLLNEETSIAYLYSGGKWTIKRREDQFKVWRTLASALSNI